MILKKTKYQTELYHLKQNQYGIKVTDENGKYRGTYIVTDKNNKLDESKLKSEIRR